MRRRLRRRQRLRPRREAAVEPHEAFDGRQRQRDAARGRQPQRLGGPAGNEPAGSRVVADERRDGRLALVIAAGEEGMSVASSKAMTLFVVPRSMPAVLRIFMGTSHRAGMAEESPFTVV